MTVMGILQAETTGTRHAWGRVVALRCRAAGAAGRRRLPGVMAGSVALE
ncbi:hypothetical protein ACFQY4_21175 [Catellatospora bangladeshensis]